MNDYSGEIAGTFIVLFFLGLFIGLIVLAVVLAKKSGDRAKEGEQNIVRMMNQLPQDKQMLFMMQYNSVKKNPTTAVILELAPIFWTPS